MMSLISASAGGASLRLSHTTARLAILVLLSWLLQAVSAKTAADYFVKSLPGQPDGPLLTMHAG